MVEHTTVHRPAVARGFWLFALLGVLAASRPSTADERTTFLRQFRDHLAEQSYSEEQLGKAHALLDADQNEPAPDILASVIAVLNPDFAAARRSYDDGNTSAAITSLKPLADSDDEFIQSEARFLLAKCLIENSDHEGALPHLDALKSSLRAGDGLFLRGICQANLLKRQAAIETFAEFMRSHPDASERQRIAAWRQLELLSMVEEGTLIDVYQKMEYSRRRLSLSRANEPTQTRQKETISILDKLIEEAEEREAVSEGESKKESQGKKSQSKSGGKGRGKEGSGEGIDDKTPMKTVRQIQEGKAATPWDHVRDKKRDAKALAAIKEKYPARYRALIEQYYRSLQEENDR